MGDDLRAEAAASRGLVRRLTDALPRLSPEKRAKAAAFIRLHTARAELFERCAESADTCARVAEPGASVDPAQAFRAILTPETSEARSAGNADGPRPAVEGRRDDNAP